MESRRLRFMAALVVFFLWTAGLGILAAKSGHRPLPRLSTTPVIPPR